MMLSAFSNLLCAQNYAGIIGLCLIIARDHYQVKHIHTDQSMYVFDIYKTD